MPLSVLEAARRRKLSDSRFGHVAIAFVGDIHRKDNLLAVSIPIPRRLFQTPRPLSTACSRRSCRSRCFLGKNFSHLYRLRRSFACGVPGQGWPSLRENILTRGRMTAKPSRKSGMAEQQAQAQLGSSNQRTLTVSALYRQWGEEHRKGECVVPSIRLSGKWLAALGLAPGQKIRVVTNGSIITLGPVAFERELCRYTK
jgi:hypothetical protein